MPSSPYPDLGELVALHGRWDLIPPEAWATYDRLVARWRAEYREEIRKLGPKKGTR